MRAIVTGGAGFLGSHLCERLLGEGWEVVAVDNLVTGGIENIAHLGDDTRFDFVEQDVSEGINVGHAFDFIFHFASPASPVDFTRIPVEVLKVNGLGTLNALELARTHNAKFMFSSTSEVYGDPLVSPQPETYWGNVNPIGVRGVYDEGKRYGEALVMAYHNFHGVDTRIVRFFNTYGPRMRLDDGRVVPNLVSQALKGEPLTIYGDGLQTRSFGYYEDIIEGVWRLAGSDYHLPVNIGNDQERTILDFARVVQEATGSNVPIKHLEAAADDPRQRKPDLTRAKTILGWSPTTPLEVGLAETVRFMKNQLEAAATS